MALQLIFFVVWVFYNSSTPTNTCVNCDILKVIFKEDFFYTSNSLNLSKVDTITIFDKYNYFKGCARKLEFKVDSNIMKHHLVYDDDEIINNVENKVVIIKTQDVLPTHLINGAWLADQSLTGKFEDYFIFNALQLSSDSLKISLFRLRSNHKVDITYRINPSNIERLGYTMGQY